MAFSGSFSRIEFLMEDGMLQGHLNKLKNGEIKRPNESALLRSFLLSPKDERGRYLFLRGAGNVLGMSSLGVVGAEHALRENELHRLTLAAALAKGGAASECALSRAFLAHMVLREALGQSTWIAEESRERVVATLGGDGEDLEREAIEVLLNEFHGEYSLLEGLRDAALVALGRRDGDLFRRLCGVLGDYRELNLSGDDSFGAAWLQERWSGEDSGIGGLLDIDSSRWGRGGEDFDGVEGRDRVGDVGEEEEEEGWNVEMVARLDIGAVGRLERWTVGMLRGGRRREAALDVLHRFPLAGVLASAAASSVEGSAMRYAVSPGLAEHCFGMWAEMAWCDCGLEGWRGDLKKEKEAVERVDEVLERLERVCDALDHAVLGGCARLMQGVRLLRRVGAERLEGEGVLSEMEKAVNAAGVWWGAGLEGVEEEAEMGASIHATLLEAAIGRCTDCEWWVTSSNSESGDGAWYAPAANGIEACVLGGLAGGVGAVVGRALHRIVCRSDRPSIPRVLTQESDLASTGAVIGAAMCRERSDATLILMDGIRRAAAHVCLSPIASTDSLRSVHAALALLAPATLTLLARASLPSDPAAASVILQTAAAASAASTSAGLAPRSHSHLLLAERVPNSKVPFPLPPLPHEHDILRTAVQCALADVRSVLAQLLKTADSQNARHSIACLKLAHDPRIAEAVIAALSDIARNPTLDQDHPTTVAALAFAGDASDAASTDLLAEHELYIAADTNPITYLPHPTILKSLNDVLILVEAKK